MAHWLPVEVTRNYTVHSDRHGAQPLLMVNEKLDDNRALDCEIVIDSGLTVANKDGLSKIEKVPYLLTRNSRTETTRGAPKMDDVTY